MPNYAWADNKSKLERAIKEVRGDNPVTNVIGNNPITEEAVKAVYVRLLGRVLETEEIVAKEAEEAAEAPKPRRRTAR